jgi:phosphate transport system permease protein
MAHSNQDVQQPPAPLTFAQTAMSRLSPVKCSPFAQWVKNGSPWIWFNAGAVAICLMMIVGLLGFIAAKGAAHFWPKAIISLVYEEPGKASKPLLGQVMGRETIGRQRLAEAGVNVDAHPQEFFQRLQIKIGNRDITGLDFIWVVDDFTHQKNYPRDAVLIERLEWGNFYGFIEQIIQDGQPLQLSESQLFEQLQPLLDRANQLQAEIHKIEVGQMGAINYQLEQLRLKGKRLQLENQATPQALADLAAQHQRLDQQYALLHDQLAALVAQAGRDQLKVKTITGDSKMLNFAKIAAIHQPNTFTFWQKIHFYFAKVVEFVADQPREANTEGGIFPAIFGTVVMVLLMSMLVTPFGVITAIYLHEYAKQGLITRIVRISVNNLAGVPSIVYGVFGLGFFVYFVGGNIDQLFYPEASPAPVFGTPGLLWASLTLALLTVPVVIVSTEEGLSRIPKSLREGSLALGATQFETLCRVVLPMASSAMMTGLILAIARAAGEVAPLMLVGVVKLAPSLPVDFNAPFIHLDRKLMHLGFHIYDVGFQSPNVEAARPLVYATAFLLVSIIAVLNLSAVILRNRLREKYKNLES